LEPQKPFPAPSLGCHPAHHRLQGDGTVNLQVIFWSFFGGKKIMGKMCGKMYENNQMYGSFFKKNMGIISI